MSRPASPVKSVLIVEDSPSLVAMYKGFIEPLRTRVRAVETLAAARRAISQEVPEAILLDLKLPDGDGLELLTELAQAHPNVLTIVITAYGSINGAVDAMREGAYDFIVKPFSQERLQTTLRNALETTVLRKTVETFQTVIERPGFEQMVGKSLPMQAVYRSIQAVAPTDASVMITGDTGTGKELCADAIHKASRRAKQNFVVLNCAAIPKDLLESELFGHLKGAFTGATANRDGAASLAHNGTLFLDELGEMDISLQSKLLRFIQSGTFQRVGSSKTEQVNVRFLAATNRDPMREVAEGRFREDLFYRLNVVPIEMPTLAERGEDILMIADAFLAKFAEADGKEIIGLSDDARQLLLDYHWPGNVRQLQNVIRNAVIFTTAPQIEVDTLPTNLMPQRTGAAVVSGGSSGSSGPGSNAVQPQSVTSEPVSQPPSKAPTSQASSTEPEQGDLAAPFEIQPMAEIERQMIDYALQIYDGNVTKVASVLDISASSVYRKRSGA